jgi:FMN phosphatase YigB (HAD superfamily)
VAVKAIFFDVGSTLIDETGMWERAADAAGVPRFTLMGALGGLAARGEHHDRVWDMLGVEQPESTWELDEFFPDALPCLARVRSQGLVAGAVGNTPAFVEDDLRAHVDIVGSSARWGIAKPAAGFFDRIVRESGLEPAEIAYVGDRVDNDVRPALAAGLAAVHLRRGPWGVLHAPPVEAIPISSLIELPEVLL